MNSFVLWIKPRLYSLLATDVAVSPRTIVSVATSPGAAVVAIAVVVVDESVEVVVGAVVVGVVVVGAVVVGVVVVCDVVVADAVVVVAAVVVVVDAIVDVVVDAVVVVVLDAAVEIVVGAVVVVVVGVVVGAVVCVDVDAVVTVVASSSGVDLVGVTSVAAATSAAAAISFARASISSSMKMISLFEIWRGAFPSSNMTRSSLSGKRIPPLASTLETDPKAAPTEPPTSCELFLVSPSLENNNKKTIEAQTSPNPKPSSTFLKLIPLI